MATLPQLRARVAKLLGARDFASLTALACQDRRVAAVLVQFIFDPTDLQHWRALEGLGQVAGTHPRQVQKVIHRLLWSLNEDSGSFGWGAAAALGEIGRGHLPLVQDIVSMFYGYLEEPFSRGPMLWGLGRFGEKYPELVQEHLPLVQAALADADPQVRAWAAWCVGRVGHGAATAALEPLLADASEVWLYDDGELRRYTVAQVAKAALDALTQGQI